MGDQNEKAAMDHDSGLFAANSGARIACPCNATYVLYACCNSADGIVFEAPKLKLGELQQDPSVSSPANS